MLIESCRNPFPSLLFWFFAPIEHGIELGVDLCDIVPNVQIKLEDLGGKSVAMDAYNALYQFLAITRQPDGTLLKYKRLLQVFSF
jgi:hypothetical protein